MAAAKQKGREQGAWKIFEEEPQHEPPMSKADSSFLAFATLPEVGDPFGGPAAIGVRQLKLICSGQRQQRSKKGKLKMAKCVVMKQNLDGVLENVSTGTQKRLN